jgi:ArsR family transcriptional regulator, arsenate/arsenite/antimonite-responsive transcriptional repressor
MACSLTIIAPMKLEDAANILAKIGNPTRLKIVRLLVRAGDDGLAVGKIQEALGIPGSTLTHHIAHLKSAGVIRQQRHQATLICTMEYGVLQELVAYLTAECCADQADRDDAA